MQRKTLKAEFSKRMRPDAPFDLEAEVAQVYKDHPHLDGHTYFFDLAKGALVHPRLDDRMAHDIGRHAKVRRYARKFAKEKASYTLVGVRDLPFNVVFLYLDKDSANLGVGPTSYSDGQTKRALFDHEVGHALTLYNKNDAKLLSSAHLLKETMAENYALLRQFQRYGSRCKEIKADRRVAMSAAYFVFGSVSNDDRLVNDHYFYSPSLESLVVLNRQFNVASLSPRETVGLARLHALKHTPGSKRLDGLRAELAVDSRDYILPALAVRVLETNSVEAFKWGSQALQYVMSGDYTRSKDAEEFRRKNWPAVSKAIARKTGRIRKAQIAAGGAY